MPTQTGRQRAQCLPFAQLRRNFFGEVRSDLLAAAVHFAGRDPLGGWLMVATYRRQPKIDWHVIESIGGSTMTKLSPRIHFHFYPDDRIYHDYQR